jgi:hypothetical protein
MGNLNLTDSPSTGLIPGIGNSSSFGASGPGTYDPRQVVMHAYVRF